MCLVCVRIFYQLHNHWYSITTVLSLTKGLRTREICGDMRTRPHFAVSHAPRIYRRRQLTQRTLECVTNVSRRCMHATGNRPIENVRDGALLRSAAACELCHECSSTSISARVRCCIQWALRICFMMMRCQGNLCLIICDLFVSIFGVIGQCVCCAFVRSDASYRDTNSIY